MAEKKSKNVASLRKLAEQELFYHWETDEGVEQLLSKMILCKDACGKGAEQLKSYCTEQIATIERYMQRKKAIVAWNVARIGELENVVRVGELEKAPDLMTADDFVAYHEHRAKKDADIFDAVVKKHEVIFAAILKKYPIETWQDYEAIVNSFVIRGHASIEKRDQSLRAQASNEKNRKLHKAIRAKWATGNYSSRDVCAEQEYSGLGFGSFKAARNALINKNGIVPDPDPWPAKEKPKK
jgi:hypothetical protein